MAHWRIALIATGVAAGLAFSGGTGAHAETLTDALASAYRTNPTLAAERAQVRALDESFVQARSAALPTISADASATATDQNSEFSATTTDAFGNVIVGPDVEISDTTGAYRYEVTASQNLYRGGRTGAAMRGAAANIEAGRSNLVTVEQNVLLSAIQAYTDVRRDAEIVRIRLSNVEVLNEQLRAARDRFEVGEITRTDVSQAEARLAGAKAQLAAARANLTVSRAAYERVVGAPAGELEPPSPFQTLPSDREQAIAFAEADNPAINAARFADEAARHGVREAKGFLLPTVSLAANAQQNEGFLTGGRDSELATVTARLSIPLYSGGRNSSAVRQAHEAANSARFQLRDAELAVREFVDQAWSGREAALSVVESSREQVKANEVALEGVQEEARVGLRTTLDVLNAEQELLNARLTLVSAERDAYVASARLVQAVGRLTARDLALPVELYDPVENFDEVRRKWIGLGISDLR